MKRVILLSGLVAGTAALGLLTAPTPAAAGSGFTHVDANTLKVDGTRYWRKKASEASPGSIGQKISPAVGANSFERKQSAPRGIFKVIVDTPITISSHHANEWNIRGGASNVEGGVGGNGDYTGDITAYKMRIDLGNTKGDLRYETNRHIGHLLALKHEGNGGRMISAVWILVNGVESKGACYGGDLTVTEQGWNVTTNVAGCSNSTYTISPGAVLAYEMVKVNKWDIQDQLTHKPSCPAAYPKYDPRSSPTAPMDRCKKVTYENSGVRCKLPITDNRANWYVSARAGRDTCKSKKGKPDKAVECVQNGHDYISQSGKDTCQKAIETYKDPFCPAGYDYDKKSSDNGGVDQCKLRGIDDLKVDGNSGF